MRIPGTNSSLVSVMLGIILAFSINQGLALALSTPMPVVAVESNSMVPTFQRGDILILQGIPSDQLGIGDVIVFSPPNQNVPVVHRIVRVNGDGTFQAAVTYVVEDGPESVFSTDLDGDGDNDLAVANWKSDTISVLLNNGDGTFQAAINYDT